jgi:hypothetical protein
MRAWILTLIDVVGVGTAYWFACWLFGDEPTLAGFAFAVAIIALLGVSRLKIGEK